MGIELKKHNLEAYEKIKEAFKRGTKVGIIHPTGTGKSFLALKLIEDNKAKEALYIAPSNSILHSIKRNIFSSGMTMANFSNLKRMTYQKLLKLSDEELAKLKPDIIILDEFHHCGAPEWENVIRKLLELNPNVQILGLSATPIRYFDFGRDMAEELFGDNIASEMSLEDAIERGILPRAKYVATIYSFEKQLKQMEAAIDKIADSEDKIMAERLFEKLSKDISKDTENLPTVLAKHMEIKNGKYIVFCKNIEDMNEKVRQAQEIFGEVNPNIKTYMVSSKLSDNDRTLRMFENDKDCNSLKLMFAVDMLNEGYHINDLDGVIMMRSTYSPTIYTQQLGRALTVKDVSDKEPLIIDLVNNFDYIKIIEELYERLRKYKKTGEHKKDDSQSWLRVDDKLKEFMDVAQRISQLSKRRKISLEEKIETFERYFEEGNDEIDGLTVFEGKPIGQWAIDIRSDIKNGYNTVRPTEEQLEKLKGFGILERKIDTTIDEKIDRVIDWYKRYPDITIETKKTDTKIGKKIIHKLMEKSKNEGIGYEELEQEYLKMQNYLEYIKQRYYKGKLTENQREKCKEGNLRGIFGVSSEIEKLAERFKIDIEQVLVVIDHYGSMENFLQRYRDGKLFNTNFYDKYDGKLINLINLTSNIIDMDYNPLSANYIQLIRDVFTRSDDIILFSSSEIEEKLKKLNEDESAVLKSLYGLTDGKTKHLYEISSQLNCSAQNVGLKHKNGLKHLRVALMSRDTIGLVVMEKLKQNELLSEEDMATLKEFEDEFWNSNIIFQHSSVEDINFDKSKFAIIKTLIKKVEEIKNEKERNAAKEKEENIANGNFDVVGIEEMDLSVKSYNILKRSGIETLGNLKNISLERLAKLRNIGRKSYEEIIAKIEEYGISLKTEEELKLSNCLSEQSEDERETVNLSVAIEDLDFGVRSYNALKRAGIDTLGDLSQITLEKLARVRNLGRKSCEEIIAKLEEYGITLKTEEELKLEISSKEQSEEELTIDNSASEQTELEVLRQKRESLKEQLQDVDEQIRQAEQLLTNYAQLAGKDITIQEDENLDIDDK